MVDAGSAAAVMGNHEFNAVAYATPDPGKAGDYRAPTRGRRARSTSTATATPRGGSLRLPAAPRGRRLVPDAPLLSGAARAAGRACVLAFEIDLRPERDPSQGFSMGDGFVVKASTKKTHEHKLIEVVLKGSRSTSRRTTSQRSGTRKVSRGRRHACAGGATTRQRCATSPRSRPDPRPRTASRIRDIPEIPCTSGEKYRYPKDERPVFFGHYWKQGRGLSPSRGPTPSASTTARSPTAVHSSPTASRGRLR